MKLDKIRFATLIGYCAGRGMTVDNTDVQAMDDMIDIEAPEVQHNYPATSDINMLMHLLYEGKQKIEAIKCYRKLTGMGLKESKDAIEKHWGLYDNPDAKLLARIRQALGTLADGDELVQIAKKTRSDAEEYARQNMANKEPATLGDILGKTTKERPPINFDKFEG